MEICIQKGYAETEIRETGKFAQEWASGLFVGKTLIKAWQNWRVFKVLLKQLTKIKLSF